MEFQIIFVSLFEFLTRHSISMKFQIIFVMTFMQNIITTYLKKKRTTNDRSPHIVCDCHINVLQTLSSDFVLHLL